MKLLKFVETHCDKHNIKLVTTTNYEIMCPGTSQMVSGFFSIQDGAATLGIAKGQKNWEEVLLHEFNHSMQWLDNAPAWTEAYLTKTERELYGFKNNDAETIDAIDLWLEHRLELNEEDISNMINRSINVELDCEKRTVMNGPRFIINFNEESYTKKANAYLRFYKYVELRRTWNYGGHPPYNDDLVVASQDTTFDQDYFAPLTSLETALYDDLVNRAKK
jgi:hypothetical protein